MRHEVTRYDTLPENSFDVIWQVLNQIRPHLAAEKGMPKAPFESFRVARRWGELTAQVAREFIRPVRCARMPIFDRYEPK